MASNKFLTDITVDGKIGVGTESPATILDVQMAEANKGLFIRRHNASGQYLHLHEADGSSHNIEAIGSKHFYITNKSTSHDLYFSTNSTIRMGITSAGNVGIGTTSPSQKLEVSGNIKATKLLLNTTNSGYTLYSNGESRINGVIFQQSSGVDYLQKASGTGDFYVRNSVSGQRILIGAANSSGQFTNYIEVDGANNDATIRTNDVDRLYIDSSGKVGIGTTSPGSALHVAGAISTAPTGDGVHIGKYSSSGNVYGHIQLQGNKGGYIDFSESGTDWKGRILYDNDSNYMRFDTSAAERMRITASGNVGIGTTGPGAKFQVYGNTNGSVITKVTNDSNGTAAYSETHWESGTSSNELRIGVAHNYSSTEWNNAWVYAINKDLALKAGSTGKSIKFYTNGTGEQWVRAIINSSGNVGIGTTSPSTKLHVEGTTKITGDTTLGTTSSAFLQMLRAGANYIAASNASGELRFRTGGSSDRMTITSGGNVGIATTSPSYKLDVTGEGRFTGALYSNSTLRGSSLKTGTISSGQPRLDSFYMQSAPETGQALAHPYLMSDLAAFELRGGTVTVTGLTTPPSSNNRLFRPDAEIWSTAASNYTGSTFVIELSDVDHVEALRYGTYCGIQFGNGGWAPASLKIEWSTDDGSTYTTALNSSAKSDFYYTKLNNGAAAITNIKFTIGQPTSSLRILNIFATDYAGRGSSAYHLSVEGGTIYGAVTVDDEFKVTDGSSAITLQEYSNGAAIFLDGVDGDFTGGDYYHIWANGSSYLGLGGYAGGATPLNINSSGNVGIGTTNPGDKLQVAGNIIAQDYLYVGDGVQHWGDGGTGMNFPSNDNIDLVTSATSRVRIDSSGNVGIGTTSPGYKLDVVGNVRIQSSNEQQIRFVHYQGSGDEFSIEHDTAGIYFYNRADSAGMFRINNDGSIRLHQYGAGILKTDSSGNISVDTNTYITASGAVDTDAYVEIGRAHVGYIGHADYAGFSHIDQNGTGSYALLQSATGTTFLNSASGKPINFRINNADKMVLASSGNVGIGTTSPSAPLDVRASSYKVVRLGNDITSHYTFSSGTSDNTLTLTCGSYYQAEVVITANQTNSGGYNNWYVRGLWSNNHTTHHWDILEEVGYLTGSDFSFTNGQNDVENSGKLVISHTYNSGSFAGMTVRVTDMYGTHSYSIS